MSDKTADFGPALFLSIVAYSNGNWSYDETVRAYEYLKREAFDSLQARPTLRLHKMDPDREPTH